MSRIQELFAQQGAERRVEKGEHLFNQGERCSSLFCVKEGLLKAYYIRPDGREHIKSFQPEGSVIGSMVALIDKGECTFSLVAVEPAQISALSYDTLDEAGRSDLELANALNQFLSTYGKKKERREYELLCLAPEERYRLLLSDAPSLAQRVSQADLAAYIGVTPQALSRIKRRSR